MSDVMYKRNEILRKKFSGHRFVTSPVGVLKLFGGIFFLISSILSLALTICTKSWLELIFPILVATCGVITILLYGFTILGLAKRIPNIWVQLDIGLSVLMAILCLVFSILLMANCTNGVTETIITGVLGIAGTLCITISAATFFIMWAKIDDEIEELPSPAEITQTDFDPKRKSVFI